MHNFAALADYMGLRGYGESKRYIFPNQTKQKKPAYPSIHEYSSNVKTLITVDIHIIVL